MPNVAVVRKPNAVARPLKVLVPLIKQKLEQVEEAGLEYQRQTGDLLIEAKGQVARGSWGAWLNRNFHLSERTSRRYMQIAEKMGESENGQHGHKAMAAVRLATSGHEITGDKARRDAWRPLFDATRDVDVEALAQQKQTRQDEVKLHRELAEELIDIGYKALAIRLHPDRGGSKDAMARLNRVREELKDIAATRRFV